ncbi:hypothetical protein DT075_37550 [Bacillus licheniformis]|nr:hypothetical protein DT075_37550 [Bacillus licheniformis]
MKKAASSFLSCMLLLALFIPNRQISAETSSERPDCRPEGLWDSGVEHVPYCDVYDKDGREKLDGERVAFNGKVYEAKWWTKGDRPDQSGEWGVWRLIGGCE